MKKGNKEKILITSYMSEKGFNVKTLSKCSNINIFKLIYLLYFPFAKIKLTSALRISKAMGVSVDQLF